MNDLKMRAAVQAVLTAAKVELSAMSTYSAARLITELIDAVRSEMPPDPTVLVAAAARAVADDYGLSGTEVNDAFCHAFEKFADKLAPSLPDEWTDPFTYENAGGAKNR